MAAEAAKGNDNDKPAGGGWARVAGIVTLLVSVVGATMAVVSNSSTIAGWFRSNPSLGHGVQTSSTKPGPRSSTTVTTTTDTPTSTTLSPSTGGLGVSVDTHLVLDATNFCSWDFGSHPIPLYSLHPVRVWIDDRCNYPANANPQTDRPTGVYSSPSKTTQPSAYVRDGQVVRLLCYQTGGEVISNGTHGSSDIWLKLASPAGLIPDVNIGGGFSITELRMLRLPAC